MADQNQTLRQAKEALDRAVIENRRIQQKLNAKEDSLERDRKTLITSIGRDILDILHPLLGKIAENAKLNKEDIKQAISESTIQVQQERPIVNVKSPDVHVPEPKVNINIPDIIVPDIKMPEEMDIKGWVRLQGVDLQNPLPVQLRDKDGRPVNLFENLTTLIGSSGGGLAHIVRIGGFSQSAYSDYLNADNRLRVSVETGAGGLTDTELRASSVPVAQASGASWSVEASQVNSWLMSQVSGANWSVEVASQPTTFDVKQLSGTTDSVYVNNPSGTGDAATALRIVVAGNSDASVSATQIGTWIVDQLSGATWSVYANNPSGQGDAATALRVVVAGNSDASVSATQVGSWTVSLSGSLTSAVAVGPSAVGIADDGNAPVQIGGIGRTTNPTKVSDGQVVKSTHDAVGRQLIRPVQVRGLIQTAYLSLTTGTEATLLAGVAGVFMDLIYAMATNSSDAAVTVDLRSATAAGIVTSIRVPANGTAGVSLAVPLPQDAAADTWTADMPDVTGTTVTIGALFSREV